MNTKQSFGVDNNVVPVIIVTNLCISYWNRALASLTLSPVLLFLKPAPLIVTWIAHQEHG